MKSLLFLLLILASVCFFPCVISCSNNSGQGARSVASVESSSIVESVDADSSIEVDIIKVNDSITATEDITYRGNLRFIGKENPVVPDSFEWYYKSNQIVSDGLYNITCGAIIDPYEKTVFEDSAFNNYIGTIIIRVNDINLQRCDTILVYRDFAYKYDDSRLLEKYFASSTHLIKICDDTCTFRTPIHVTDFDVDGSCYYKYWITGDSAYFQWDTMYDDTF